MSLAFSDAAEQTLAGTKMEAQRRGFHEANIVHLMLAILAKESGSAFDILATAGLDYETAARMATTTGKEVDDVGISRLNSLIGAADRCAELYHFEQIDDIHLLYALMMTPAGSINVIFNAAGVNDMELFRTIVHQLECVECRR